MEGTLAHCTPPKPARQISKTSAYIFIAVVGVIATISIVMSHGKRSPKETASSTQKAYPNSAVGSLASSYSDLPIPTIAPTVRPLLIEDKSLDSEYQKLLEKMKADKLKRADDARHSSLSFQGISVPVIPSQPIDTSSEVDSNGKPSTLNPRDFDNRQDEKKEFLISKNDKSTMLSSKLVAPRSDYQLMAGTIISGVMLTGINSDLPGQLLGQVSQNIFDTVHGAHLLIPQGTRVLGSYDSRIVYGQERVLIVWTRLIFPNGKSISLEGMPGVDMSGYAGLSDQVNNHYLRLLTGVVFSSLLSAGAQMAEGRTYNSVNPQYDELALQGAAKNINQVGQEITHKNLNIQPTLEIRPGFRFNVFVNKDIVLEPYSP